MKIVMQQFYEISWFFICIVYFVILLPHYIPCRSFNLTVRNKKKNIRWRGLASLERPARTSGNRAWNVYDATRRDASSGRHMRRGVAERQRRPRSTTRSRESWVRNTARALLSRGELCQGQRANRAPVRDEPKRNERAEFYLAVSICLASVPPLSWPNFASKLHFTYILQYTIHGIRHRYISFYQFLPFSSLIVIFLPLRNNWNGDPAMTTRTCWLRIYMVKRNHKKRESLSYF